MSDDGTPVTPATFAAALEAVEGAARPLVALHLTDEPADPPGVYTSDDGPLLVPYDVANGLGMDVMRTLLQAADAVPELAMALARVAALHRPVHIRYTRASGVIVDDVCPDCLGGMLAADPLEPRECGCWGMAVAYCAECATSVGGGGRMAPVPWPCPTWMPLDRLADWSRQPMPAEVGGVKENEAPPVKRLAPREIGEIVERVNP